MYPPYRFFSVFWMLVHAGQIVKYRVVWTDVSTGPNIQYLVHKRRRRMYVLSARTHTTNCSVLYERTHRQYEVIGMFQTHVIHRIKCSVVFELTYPKCNINRYVLSARVHRKKCLVRSEGTYPQHRAVGMFSTRVSIGQRMFRTHASTGQSVL